MPRLRGMSYAQMKLSLAAGLVAAAFSSLSCGGATKVRVDDERLARLPAGEREALVEREREVRVAESDLTAARVAAKDAARFLDVVETERSSANQRREAARKAMELAESTQDRSMLDDSRRTLTATERQVGAANAKLAYGRDMKALRDAEVDSRVARLEAERADLELAKVDRLLDRGQGQGLERARFVDQQAEARQRQSEAEARVAELREVTRQSRIAWRSHPGADQPSAQIDETPLPPRPIEPPRE